MEDESSDRTLNVHLIRYHAQIVLSNYNGPAKQYAYVTKALDSVCCSLYLALRDCS